MFPPPWFTTIADLAEVLAMLVAAAGLIYTGKQLALSRKATGAQLMLQVMLQVDESLREFDDTVQKLREGSLKGDELEVQRLMGAMERLHVLVSKGLVDQAEVANLHGWRLGALLGNEYVRSYLHDYAHEWQRLLDLERMLAESRETRKS